MSQVTFKKNICYTGEYGRHNALVVATMNYAKERISGTNNFTHDEYSRDVWLHKIEVFINGGLPFISDTRIKTESELYNQADKFIIKAKEELRRLATTPPPQSFTEKMNKLFKDEDEAMFARTLKDKILHELFINAI